MREKQEQKSTFSKSDGASRKRDVRAAEDGVQLIFEHEHVVYSGTFVAGKRTGRMDVGQFVKVKYSTSNASRSKMVSLYKEI